MAEITGVAAKLRPRLHPRFAKLLLLFGGILVALLLAEVALRASGFTYFNPYIVDQDVGYSLRPGAEGWWKKEALTYVKINGQGFRDREHAIAKPPDRDEVQAKGAKFLVVTGSMGIQVSPDPDARQEYMNRLGIRSLFYPDQRIKALGDHEGFKVLNLAPGLEDYASRNRVFLHGAGDVKGRGHWNEIGHRLAGELIAQKLCKVVLEEE